MTANSAMAMRAVRTRPMRSAIQPKDERAQRLAEIGDADQAADASPAEYASRGSITGST